MSKMVGDNFADGIMALPSFPVVLVTVDQNIMTAAAFHFYSFNPASVMVGGIKPDKYTHGLIQEKGEFGINIPTVDMLDKVQICGSLSGKNENKYAKAGLTPKRSNKIDSFIIAECPPVNLECKVVHRIEYEGSHSWFIGEIQQVHLAVNYVRDQALMFWLGQFRAVGGHLIEGADNSELFTVSFRGSEA